MMIRWPAAQNKNVQVRLDLWGGEGTVIRFLNDVIARDARPSRNVTRFEDTRVNDMSPKTNGATTVK